MAWQPTASSAARPAFLGQAAFLSPVLPAATAISVPQAAAMAAQQPGVRPAIGFADLPWAAARTASPAPVYRAVTPPRSLSPSPAASRVLGATTAAITGSGASGSGGGAASASPVHSPSCVRAYTPTPQFRNVTPTSSLVRSRTPVPALTRSATAAAVRPPSPLGGCITSVQVLPRVTTPVAQARAVAAPASPAQVARPGSSGGGGGAAGVNGSEFAAVRAELDLIRQQLDDLLGGRTLAVPAGAGHAAVLGEPLPSASELVVGGGGATSREEALRAELEEAKLGAARAQAEKQALAAELAALKAALTAPAPAPGALLAGAAGAQGGASGGFPVEESPAKAAAARGLLGGAAGRSQSSRFPRLEQLEAADYTFSLENVLDILQPCSRSLVIFRCVLQAFETPQEQAEAVAKLVASEAGAVLPDVAENLRCAADPLPASVEGVLRHVLELHGAWQFNATGRVDLPPELLDPYLQRLTISQEEMSTIRRLTFPHIPPQMLDHSVIQGLRLRQFAGTVSDPRPTAVVMVGPPGSGKSQLLQACTQILQQQFHAPNFNQYVHIDPDYYIAQPFEHNNFYRDAANFCNHESLLCAVGTRRNILFDHVGKDLQNTCGRCVTRFRQAGYLVFVCIVVARFPTCQRRIRQRSEKIGRGVPLAYLRQTFEALQKTAPVFLLRQAHIAEAVLVYDNDADNTTSKAFHAPDAEPKVRVVAGGGDASEAVAFVQSMLRVPQGAE